MKILGYKEFGPIYRFTDAEIYWTLWYLSRAKILGRRTIASNVGLGEGSIRSILNILKEWDLVHIRSKGIVLSENGRRFLDAIPLNIVEIPVLGNYLDDEELHRCCVHVSKRASKVTDGIRQRDMCIKNGAKGCVTFVMTDGRLTIPPDIDMESNHDVTGEIVKSAGMCNGDVLVVGYSLDRLGAANGALSASLDLI